MNLARFDVLKVLVRQARKCRKKIGARWRTKQRLLSKDAIWISNWRVVCNR